MSEKQTIDDLAMLVKRMARKLKDHESGIAATAMDYLKRKGLQGSILRDEEVDRQRKERWESEE